MRVLCTGGAGFIGSHVAEALIQAAHTVLVFDDLSTGKRTNIPQGAEFVQGDIRDGKLLHRVFSEFRPEAVTHQAAQTSVAVSTREPLRDAEINLLGSLNILQQCVQHKVRQLVFASTGGAIYGEVPEGQWASVNWPPCPLSPYACSKLAAETYIHAYAKEYGLRTSVLRYANVYGPRQDPHGEAGVVAIFAQRILDGEALQVNARKELGDEGCVRDYVYVADVVRTNLLAIAGRLAPPVINVCTGVPTSTLEVARLLMQAAAVNVTIVPGPRRPGDLLRSVLAKSPDVDPLDSSILGPTVPLREGLLQTLNSFRRQKP